MVCSTCGLPAYPARMSSSVMAAEIVRGVLTAVDPLVVSGPGLEGGQEFRGPGNRRVPTVQAELADQRA